MLNLRIVYFSLRLTQTCSVFFYLFIFFQVINARLEHAKPEYDFQVFEYEETRLVASALNNYPRATFLGIVK